MMKAPSLAMAFLQCNLVPHSILQILTAPLPHTLPPAASILHPPPFIPPPSSCLFLSLILHPLSPILHLLSPPSPASSPHLLHPLSRALHPAAHILHPLSSALHPAAHPSPFSPASFPCLQRDQHGWGSSKGSKTPGKRGLGGQRSRAGPGAGPNEAVPWGCAPLGSRAGIPKPLKPPGGLLWGSHPAWVLGGCFGCWVPSFRGSS